MSILQIDSEFAFALQQDLEKFDRMLGLYKAGDIDEEEFRIFRLNNGIYGQRQGGTNQMVRVKVPYGSIHPDQLEVLGKIARDFSRGWGHLTTRQNIQFHSIELDTIPDLLRQLAVVGLHSREACGDTVRNVAGCHLAGACPHEVLDISPWAEATYRHFLHHPYAQRMPRKVKMNFSGCATDCGQAMFNDVGVVAVSRQLSNGGVERGFRVFIGGGLGANPHPAQALEEFTERERLLATLEACIRTFDHYGNRDNKIRARLKWLVDTMGMDELRARILKERKLLIGSSSCPEGLPEIVLQRRDDPAGLADGLVATPMGVPVSLRVGDGTAFERWKNTNVIIGVAKGTVSAIAHARLGDITAEQFGALGSIQRDLDASVRVTNRQNLAFRDLRPDQLPELHARLDEIGMASAGAELARDVVSCPGADTCSLAITQSRGLASNIGAALEQTGLADVGGVRINISGCTNSCGQHHVADIGFQGAERRAHGKAAPGYQMYLGGRVAQMEIKFADKALRLPAKAVAEATVRVVGRFAGEREAGEDFGTWLDRCGGAKQVGAALKDLDDWPTPEDKPDYYIDFNETGPYVVDVGIGECLGS